MYKGLKNGPPIKNLNVKITLLGHMMAPAKRFGALSVTQKNMAFLKVPFWKKSRKTTLNAYNQEEKNRLTSYFR